MGVLQTFCYDNYLEVVEHHTDTNEYSFRLTEDRINFYKARCIRETISIRTNPPVNIHTLHCKNLTLDYTNALRYNIKYTTSKSMLILAKSTDVNLKYLPTILCDDYERCSYSFSGCANLDYSDLELQTRNNELLLCDCDIIDVKDFPKNINTLFIDNCTKLSDLEGICDLDVIKFYLHIHCKLSAPIKNLTHVFYLPQPTAGNNIRFSISDVYSYDAKHFEPYSITQNYAGKDNRIEYVMDYTIEMIDSGFSEYL